ncbi:MAG: DUF2281 domain-containing protein [Treponema sp.]|jgi:hypothetical protein|nr:DUF2281 domain-containing protein [Treponema sp.]
MIQKFLTPSGEQVTFTIPRKYVGTELEIIIFPVNDVSSTPEFLQKKPVFGCAKGKFEMAEDFDAPLDDFAEYMR